MEAIAKPSIEDNTNTASNSYFSILTVFFIDQAANNFDANNGWPI